MCCRYPHYTQKKKNENNKQCISSMLGLFFSNVPFSSTFLFSIRTWRNNKWEWDKVVEETKEGDEWTKNVFCLKQFLLLFIGVVNAFLSDFFFPLAVVIPLLNQERDTAIAVLLVSPCNQVQAMQ